MIILPYVKIGTIPFGPAIVKSKKKDACSRGYHFYSQTRW